MLRVRYGFVLLMRYFLVRASKECFLPLEEIGAVSLLDTGAVLRLLRVFANPVQVKVYCPFWLPDLLWNCGVLVVPVLL
jgi:hypothetical protein